MDNNKEKNVNNICSNVDNFVEETFAERFWGAVDNIPYAQQASIVGGHIKTAVNYSRTIGQKAVTSAAVLFLPLLLDKVM